MWLTMLTFISGWRSIDRDQALLKHRDPNRRAIFFIDNASQLPFLMQDAPIIDVWRNGLVDFRLGNDPETLIRVNYDPEHELLVRAVAHVLLIGADAQIIITYDSGNSLYRLYHALRAADALVIADERLDAPVGDRVLFTRGGSFSWRDHLLESQTALLMDSEVLDAGIVTEEDPLA